ncbi:hypothetical protein P2318_05165 [Myxococcaceae bacterium GXIMD 01537]
MSRWMLSGLLVVGVGCAGSGGALRAGAQPGVLLNQDTDEPLVLTTGTITGPRSSLSVREDGMSGRFRELPVALRWDYQELSGDVGRRKTRLELAEGDDTRIWGQFASLPVDLIQKGALLYGYVGACVYVMEQSPEGFLGKRDCGDGMEAGVAMSFPAPLQQRPLGEKAALLTLTFANDAEANTPASPLVYMTRARDMNASRSQSQVRRYGGTR